MIQKTMPRQFGPGPMPAWHRPWLRYVDSPDEGGAQDAPEAADADETDAGEADTNDQSDEQSDESGDQFDAEKAREKIRKINSENRNLRQRAAAAEEKAKNADPEKLTALEAENLRLKVAVKHGLPESLVKRLTGTTEDELLADAEELLELIGGKKPPTQQPKQKLRSPGQQPDSAEVNVDEVVKRVFEQ